MKSITLMLIAATVLTALVEFPLFGDCQECDNFKDAEKFDCYPEPDDNEEKCKKRGCCWSPRQMSGRAANHHSKPLDVPYCYYPRNFGGYEYFNLTRTDQDISAFMKRTFASPYPNDVKNLKIDVEYQTDNRVRVKISDADRVRYESTYPKISKPKVQEGFNRNYDVEIDLKQTGFKIVRKNGGDTLFNSQNLGGFIFADKFLQISSTLSGRIYGLGEHRTTFWLDTNWTRYTLFTHDAAPSEEINLYGSHPFYLVMEPNGKSHGVFLHNSNAIDVLLQPLPAITFRAIGGILDFYFFMGPTPADVIRQYTELIGRPFFPPYWSLGFHLCKYGYGSAEKTREVWQRTRDAKIPFDVQWNDIDYMSNQNSFTVDENKYKTLPQLVQDIHEAGMHYIPLIDPGVSASEPKGTYPPFDDGVKEDILVKNEDGSIFIGKVWNPNSTAYPDFTNPKTQKYWTRLLQDLHEKIPFDGMWIDMNEPSNFLDGGFNGCPDNELENPPYVPGVNGGKLRHKTICMSAKQYAGRHYDVHNLYGISEADVTFQSVEEITKKRPFLVSRSTFAGSGKYTAHWEGDNFSTWHDLTKSIPALLSYSLYGIPFAGSDICGFNYNTTQSLCNRWMQLGAFYPFSRNHNSLDNIDQDPVALGPEVVKSSINALTVRYSLLPYLYTLFYKAHVFGDTVARPLFFEFPEDENTHEVDRAFLWGSGFYIVPVTEDNSQKVQAYIPAGKWYDWYTLSQMESKGEKFDLQADNEHIPLLIRGGIVLPIQTPGPTTTHSRKNGFTFLVAPDANNKARGDLFWDDGISTDTIKMNKYGYLNFTLTERNFTSQVVHWNISEAPKLDTIKILGVKSVTKVVVNQSEKDFKFKSSVLTVPNINLPINTNITLWWTE